jgi:hypothetical protein
MRHLHRLLLGALLLGFVLYSCNPDVEDPRDKFTGTWLADEGNNMKYNVSISLDPNNNKRILFYNFHNLGAAEHVYGEVDGFNVTIPFQQACQGTYQIQGSGVMNSAKTVITLNYTVDDGANKETYNVIYTKQS